MTVRDDAYIEVQNLTDHMVVYKSYDGKRQAFQAHQMKKIRAEELRQLAYSKGGLRLLRHFLSVKNQELAREFNISDDSFEHEYQWKAEDIDNVLLNGSLDALKDALDFAPDGVVQTIVDRAVKLKISDVTKRKVIQEKTGRDINNMIGWVEKSAEDTDAAVRPINQPKTRRVDAKEESKPTRRVQE